MSKLKKIRARVREILDGSDGRATTKMYVYLDGLGAKGLIAKALFRATKNSFRAKKYRGKDSDGKSYKSLAYHRKNDSINDLCEALSLYSGELNMVWGWRVDEDKQPVLTVDLPTGQVSFHTLKRLSGPSYTGEWDGVLGEQANRVVDFVADVVFSCEE